MAGEKLCTKINRETVDEVEFHIDMRMKEYVDQGLSADEARRMALTHFGPPEVVERRIRRAKEPAGRRGRRVALVLLVLIAAGSALYVSGVLDRAYGRVTGEYPERAPWDAVRWNGTTPEVRVDGRWFGVRRIEQTPTVAVVAFCQERWPNIWKKRFEEDLVEAMACMGAYPPRSVDLQLLDLESGDVVPRNDVPMTEANRRAIWRAADNGAPR